MYLLLIFDLMNFISLGPWEVSMAKELSPDSIRGTYGESNVRSSVHCTDLITDGVMDCEYCFRCMQ